MDFKAKSYKVPIYVTFVSLRTAALSPTGACSIKAAFATDDFTTKFSLAKCPCYILQSRPEQQGGEFPSTDTVCGVREVGPHAFPRAGVWESVFL